MLTGMEWSGVEWSEPLRLGELGRKDVEGSGRDLKGWGKKGGAVSEGKWKSKSDRIESN